MARTDGHGNPNWTRDETILALDLFMQAGGRLSSKDERVRELSACLRSLPYHTESARKETFRNPAGVSFKVQNLRQVATGSGLGNVSEMDRALWAELGTNRDEVSRLAALIKAAIPEETGTGAHSDLTEAGEFYEGELLFRRHYFRERNRTLRRALLNSRGNLNWACEICDNKYEHLPIEWRDAVFEGHHIVPLALAGPGRTKLSDMALLCASCHRLLHRAISDKKEWVGIAHARSILRAYG